MRRNAILVYGLLAALWLGILIWQAAEHRRLARSLEERLGSRAHDIATSLAVVIRSQRRLGVVSRNRLEAALQDLAQSSELLGIALLNPSGETVAAGGEKIPDDLSALPPGQFVRTPGRWTTAALVELGAEPPPSWGRSRRSPPPEELAEKTASAVVWSPDDSAPPGAPGEAPGRRLPPEGAPAGSAVLPPSAVPAPSSAEAPPPPAPPDGAEGGPPPPLEGAEDGPPRPPHWSRGLRSHP
ncbi:MAG: hypothetical protein GX595_01700, partial [Lentisphaerae bacterium]|nr:hypothetical protein [Lentisphaerota bacterium]